MIEFTIKTLDSSNHTIRVEDDTTVYGLKQKIVEQLGIDINHQRLIFFGRVLHDSSKLADYGIHGKVVHLVERPPPRFAQSSNTTEDMADRQRMYDANARLRSRSLSPTRGRIDYLQRTLGETRNLIEELRNPEVWAPIPHPGEEANIPHFRDAFRRPRCSRDSSPPRPSREWYLREGLMPTRRSGSTGSLRRRHDDSDDDDSNMNTITDRLGRILEPRPRVTTLQRYTELLTQLMEMERQFNLYREFYIDWIRDTCTNLNTFDNGQNFSGNPEQAQEAAPPEASELTRSKHRFSSLISQIHHGLAHAHHVISDINFVVTDSGNRLLADPLVPNNNDVAAHVHMNVIQSMVGFPRDDFGMEDHQAQGQLYLRRHQPIPNPAPPVQFQQLHQHYQQMQYQSQRPQLPNICHMGGVQMNRHPCRIQTQRITVPYQPRLAHIPYQPPIPQQTLQFSREIGPLPPHLQDPTQPTQFQLTTEIILQPVTAPSPPMVFSSPGVLNMNQQNRVSFQVNLESRPGTTGEGQTSNSSTSTDYSDQTSTSSTPNNGSQSGRPTVFTVNIGPTNLDGTESASVNVGTAPETQSTSQAPTTSANEQSTQDNQGGQGNSNHPPTEGRGVFLDVQSMLGRLQQANQGRFEVMMSLEPPPPPAEAARAFVINNPHLPPHMLAAAANILSVETPNDPNGPMSAMAAGAIARLAAAQAASAAVRLAAAETMAAQTAITAAQITSQEVAATAAAAAAAANANATARAPGAQNAAPSAPPQPTAPQHNTEPMQPPRRPPTHRGTSVEPTSLYLYDRFLLCESHHARQQLVRRRQKWEELRRSREERAASDELRRGLRESSQTSDNEEATDSLIRLNRPMIFWESVFVAVIVSMHEATSPPEYRALLPQEFENLQGVLLMGLRRLTENDVMPVTASSIATHILRSHIPFIESIDRITRIRHNVDVYGSIHCLITTYMPALCALVQRLPTSRFVMAFCQLFSNLFYDLGCLLVHICQHGYEGSTMIHNFFIETMGRQMDSEANALHVMTLARSLLDRVEDRIETAPCDPHQYVVREDGVVGCICPIDAQSCVRPVYRVRQREVLISLYDNEPVGPPPYPAPRVGPQADRSGSDGNECGDRTGDAHTHSHSCFPHAHELLAEQESDNDSDGYISPIAPAEIQTDAGATIGLQQQEYQRLMNDATHLVTYDNVGNEYDHRVIMPPRDIFPISGVLPDTGYPQRPQRNPEPIYARVVPQMMVDRDFSQAEYFELEQRAPDYLYSPRVHYAPSAPEETKPNTPEPEPRVMVDASTATHEYTTLYPVISLPAPPVREPVVPVPVSEPVQYDTQSPATKRIKQESDENGETSAESPAASAIRKVTLQPESKRKFPTIRHERAPNSNDRTPPDDSEESMQRKSMQCGLGQWQSVLDEDERAAAAEPQPQDALSDAYLAGMTPRRRRRAMNTRPPQEAAAFIHDCVTSALEREAGGAAGAAGAAGPAESMTEAEGASFQSFYDYLRTLTTERAAASEDYRPTIHSSAAKMIGDDFDQEDQPNPDV